MSLGRTFQIHSTAPKHSVICSQHHQIHPTVPLFRTLCVYIQSGQEIRSLRFTLLAVRAVSQFDSDNEQVDVTKITDRLCKLKRELNIFYKIRKYVWKFSERIYNTVAY